MFRLSDLQLAFDQQGSNIATTAVASKEKGQKEKESKGLKRRRQKINGSRLAQHLHKVKTQELAIGHRGFGSQTAVDLLGASAIPPHNQTAGTVATLQKRNGLFGTHTYAIYIYIYLSLSLPLLLLLFFSYCLPACAHEGACA